MLPNTAAATYTPTGSRQTASDIGPTSYMWPNFKFSAYCHVYHDDLPMNALLLTFFIPVKKVKISLLQAVEALRVARGRGSHIS
jgi:hypothetical protein